MLSCTKIFDEICINFAQLLLCNQTDHRRLPQQDYYLKNFAKINSGNSARYRKQATAERESSVGLAFSVDMLPSAPRVLQRKEEKKARKSKSSAKVQALPEPRMIYPEKAEI